MIFKKMGIALILGYASSVAYSCAESICSAKGPEYHCRPNGESIEWICSRPKPVSKSKPVPASAPNPGTETDLWNLIFPCPRSASLVPLG